MERPNLPDLTRLDYYSQINGYLAWLTQEIESLKNKHKKESDIKKWAWERPLGLQHCINGKWETHELNCDCWYCENIINLHFNPDSPKKEQTWCEHLKDGNVFLEEPALCDAQRVRLYKFCPLCAAPRPSEQSEPVKEKQSLAQVMADTYWRQDTTFEDVAKAVLARIIEEVKELRLTVGNPELGINARAIIRNGVLDELIKRLEQL